MLVGLGDWNVGPSRLDDSEGVSKDDKILLNCLEHVSNARVCCLTSRAEMTLCSFSSRHLLCGWLG
jgi:hypothetical protein